MYIFFFSERRKKKPPYPKSSQTQGKLSVNFFSNPLIAFCNVQDHFSPLSKFTKSAQLKTLSKYHLFKPSKYKYHLVHVPSTLYNLQLLIKIRGK